MREKFVVRKYRAESKVCPQCGKRFTASLIQKYCSPECRRKADYERHAEEYRQERRERYRRQKEQAAKK